MVLKTSQPWLGALVAAAISLAAAGASAQPSETGDVAQRRQEAKEIADSAYQLLQKGLYAEAGELFRKADSRFHSPVFVVFQAECEEKQGKLVAARTLLAGVVEEKLAEYAPDSFYKAQRDAKDRLARVEARVPTLTVTLQGDGKLTVDDAAINPGEPVRLDPGKHRIVVIGADGTQKETFVDLAEGQRAEATMTLADPGAGNGDPGDKKPSGGRNWVGPGVAFGVGGAGLLVGVITGGIFAGKAGDLKDQCEAPTADGETDPNTCPTTSMDLGDEVTTLGTVSTVSFVIAGAGAAAGVILLVIDPGGKESATAPALRIGPTGFAIEGRF